MSDNKVEIKDVQAGGSVAGRDINQFYAAPVVKSEYLTRLYTMFQEQRDANPVVKKIIDDLDYYNSEPDGGEVIGLDVKLNEGNRGDIIWYAKNLKDKYHRKLFQMAQFSEASQEINVFLLATVQTYFTCEIYPKICEGASNAVIDSLINEKVIKPLMAELGENSLGYTTADIQGMLFFLTGNCHLKWK